MKTIITFALCAILLVSCSVQYSGDPFLPFRGEPQAEIELVFGGQGSRLEYSGGTISFVSPNELNGYRMYRRESRVYIEYETLSFAVSDSAGRVLSLCESVFSPENATEIRAEHHGNEKNGGKTVTVVESGSYIYLFASDGTPLSVSGSFEGEVFEMTFISFAVDEK